MSKERAQRNGYKLGMLKITYRKKKQEWERLRKDFAILSYLTR